MTRPGIAMGPGDNLYIVEGWSSHINHHILQFTPDGHIVRTLTNGALHPAFPGEARGIAVDSHGNIYVTYVGYEAAFIVTRA